MEKPNLVVSTNVSPLINTDQHKTHQRQKKNKKKPRIIPIVHQQLVGSPTINGTNLILAAQPSVRNSNCNVRSSEVAPFLLNSTDMLSNSSGHSPY